MSAIFSEQIPPRSASKPKRRYMLYAKNAAGQLVHCGPREFSRQPSLATIRRDIREWEKWADGIAAKWPDCGTAAARRTTVRVIVQSCAMPDMPPARNAVLFFDIPPADSVAMPLPAAGETAAA